MAKRSNQTVDDCSGWSGGSWGDCPQGEPQNLPQVHARQNPQTRFCQGYLACGHGEDCQPKWGRRPIDGITGVLKYGNDPVSGVCWRWRMCRVLV